MFEPFPAALTTAFFFYLTVSCTGYASLGNATPGLVLNGFTGKLRSYGAWAEGRVKGLDRGTGCRVCERHT